MPPLSFLAEALMTYREVLEQVLNSLDEYEKLSGKQLTEQRAGSILVEIGEAMKAGKYANETAASLDQIPCAPSRLDNITAPNIDSTMCVGCCGPF
jgi:hypothetical protein